MNSYNQNIPNMIIASINGLLNTQAEDDHTDSTPLPSSCHKALELAHLITNKAKTDAERIWRAIDYDSISTDQQKLQYAVLLATFQDPESAEKLVQNLYANNPDLKDGYARIGWSHFWPQKDYGKTITLMLRDDTSGRLSPAWRLNMAQAYAANGEIEKVRTLLVHCRKEKLLTNDQTQNSLALVTRTLMDSGQLHEAETFVSQLNLNETHNPAVFANALMQIVRAGKASRCTEAVLNAFMRQYTTLPPELSVPLCFWAKCTDSLPFATELLRQRLSVSSTDTTARFLELWIRAQEGGDSNLEYELKQLLVSEIRTVNVFQTLAYVYLSEGKEKKAESCLRKAIAFRDKELHPSANGWIPYFTLSLLLKANNRIEEARILSKNGRDQGGYMNLCDLLLISMDVGNGRATVNPELINVFRDRALHFSWPWTFFQGWIYIQATGMARLSGNNKLANEIIAHDLAACPALSQNDSIHLSEITSQLDLYTEDKIATILSKVIFPNHSSSSLLRQAIENDYLHLSSQEKVLQTRL